MLTPILLIILRRVLDVGLKGGEWLPWGTEVTKKGAASWTIIAVSKVWALSHWFTQINSNLWHYDHKPGANHRLLQEFQVIAAIEHLKQIELINQKIWMVIKDVGSFSLTAFMFHKSLAQLWNSMFFFKVLLKKNEFLSFPLFLFVLIYFLFPSVVNCPHIWIAPYICVNCTALPVCKSEISVHLMSP